MLSIAISEHRPAKRHGLQHTSLIYAQSTPPFLEYQCADIVLVVQHFHRLVGHNLYRHIGQYDVRPNVHQKCRLKPHRLDHMFAQVTKSRSCSSMGRILRPRTRSCTWQSWTSRLRISSKSLFCSTCRTTLDMTFCTKMTMTQLSSFTIGQALEMVSRHKPNDLFYGGTNRTIRGFIPKHRRTRSL